MYTGSLGARELLEMVRTELNLKPHWQSWNYTRFNEEEIGQLIEHGPMSWQLLWWLLEWCNMNRLVWSEKCSKANGQLKTRVSQPQHQWHFELDASWLWVLSHAIEVFNSVSGFCPANSQQHPTNDNNYKYLEIDNCSLWSQIFSCPQLLPLKTIATKTLNDRICHFIPKCFDLVHFRVTYSVLSFIFLVFLIKITSKPTGIFWIEVLSTLEKATMTPSVRMFAVMVLILSGGSILVHLSLPWSSQGWTEAF